MANKTQKEKLIELLKKNWMSSFQMQQILKSSSADRVMRIIRQNPPEGYVIDCRNKEFPIGTDGVKLYNKCLEYKLVEVTRI